MCLRGLIGSVFILGHVVPQGISSNIATFGGYVFILGHVPQGISSSIATFGGYVFILGHVPQGISISIAMYGGWVPFTQQLRLCSCRSLVDSGYPLHGS